MTYCPMCFGVYGYRHCPLCGVHQSADDPIPIPAETAAAFRLGGFWAALTIGGTVTQLIDQKTADIWNARWSAWRYRGYADRGPTL